MTNFLLMILIAGKKLKKLTKVIAYFQGFEVCIYYRFSQGNGYTSLANEMKKLK